MTAAVHLVRDTAEHTSTGPCGKSAGSSPGFQRIASSRCSTRARPGALPGGGPPNRGTQPGQFARGGTRSQNVTGPSLTSLTCMWAPNSPVGQLPSARCAPSTR